jgi:hypothetical protein
VAHLWRWQIDFTKSGSSPSEITLGMIAPAAMMSIASSVLQACYACHDLLEGHGFVFQFVYTLKLGFGHSGIKAL